MGNTGDDTQSHDPAWYSERIDYMSEFMTPRRMESFRKVLRMRTRWMTVCSESTFHPHNASALIRTAEAFGIQEIHAIEALCKFRPSKDVVKGTDKWIELHRHRSASEAIAALRDSGYRIIATTPRADDRTPLDFDVSEGPFALMFGTEHAGISDEILSAADGFIRIPMCGFVESLNISASAAILLYNLSEKIRARQDIPWQLSVQDSQRILLDWTMASVRDAERILATRFPE